MALASHSRLGPYEILEPIGSGGVGEVYKARDTRLDRVVAVKVLSPKFAADPEFRARFDREARAVSALDHPHICALYDVGEQDGLSFLVMQYLEGETLATRIERGALPLREALPIAIQIAEALNDAHHAGLIHRDLKPANIMLVRNGSGVAEAKLLDFGLAQAPGAAPPPSTLTNAPTVNTPLTVQGAIAGTWQYMAPEILEGKEPDARTDVFAFGCVLFEMLTGHKAFDGKTQASVIGAIMHLQPPAVSTVQPASPPDLDRLVLKCLEKDAGHRWQTAFDLLDELRWIAAGGERSTTPAAPAGAAAAVANSRWLAWGVSALLLLTTVGLAAALILRRPPVDTRVFRSTFVPQAALSGPPSSRLAMSPDGRRLAFIAPASIGSRTLMVWIRSLDGLAGQPLAGTENALAPFWSPDSRLVAFVADGKLKKIDASGGPVVTLTGPADPLPGTWNRDDVILFTAGSATVSGASILRVSAAGGEPMPATTLDAKAGETGHLFPRFLPDGQHFLFLAVADQKTAIDVGVLDSNERTKLLDGYSNAEYADGHLLFLRNGTLMAQPFDASRRALSGEAVPLADQIVAGGGRQAGLGAFSASESGVIAYQAIAAAAESQMFWFDRTGKEIGPLGERAPFGTEVNLSPDGTHAAVTVQAGLTFDIWLFDVMRGLRTKFTFDQMSERSPVWSPDGSQIVFASNRKGAFDLYRKASDGSGVEEVLLADANSKYSEMISPDGRFLLYWVFTPTGPGATNDIWVLPLAGDRKPYPFTQTPFTEYRAQFSPNGRWIAYASNESGRFEVYATTFPGAGGKRQISADGGSDPRWRADGRELFYVTDANKLMAAAVNAAGDRFEIGDVRPLFDIKPPAGGRAFYDVSRDGQRFLVNTVDDVQVLPVSVIVNWPALVSR